MWAIASQLISVRPCDIIAADSVTGPESLVAEVIARRKATRWLVENVGNMLTAGEGRLIEVSGRPTWRFGTYVTGRYHAPLGPIGYVYIDARKGELIPNEAAWT